MSDLIKRSDAIEAFADVLDADFPYVSEVTPMERIEAIPSAQPKRGEWIDDEFVGQYRCSECDYYAIDEYDFCPNCGARMKGVTDGNK